MDPLAGDKLWRYIYSGWANQKPEQAWRENAELQQSQVYTVHSWLSFLGDWKEDSVRMKEILSVGNVDDSYSYPLGLKCTPYTHSLFLPHGFRLEDWE